jgi:alanyl-tRNA synthetase
MGFERVTGIMQNTRNFTDFTRVISNYETDIFRPIFDSLEKLSGKKYRSALPQSPGSAVVSTASVSIPPTDPPRASSEQIQTDIAFRVIANHIRTLSFSIADGILPGNNDRNYVLRRILRRAVRYGRTLGFHEPFFYKLVEVLAEAMGDVFPELRKKQSHVQEVIKAEEEAFNKTLDTGMAVFEDSVSEVESLPIRLNDTGGPAHFRAFRATKEGGPSNRERLGTWDRAEGGSVQKTISGAVAFKLYDTYGFPLDLTDLMARERGLTVDTAGFEKLMEEQRARARAAQKKEIIAASNLDTSHPTDFVGFDRLSAPRWTPPRSTRRWGDRWATPARFARAKKSGPLSTLRRPATPSSTSSPGKTPRNRARPSSFAWMPRAAPPFSAIIRSRIFCTGLCTKSSAEMQRRKAPTSGRRS